MLQLDIIQRLVHSTVERLFLIVFPPYGEEKMADFDMRLGLVIKEVPDTLFTIGTDLSDIWSPIVGTESIPSQYYHQTQFEGRMQQWMKQEIDDNFELEYYEFTDSDYYKNIIGKSINRIDVLMIEGVQEPFGLKFVFENDYILSFPCTDGNTIETKQFNNNGALRYFGRLGTVVYHTIKFEQS